MPHKIGQESEAKLGPTGVRVHVLGIRETPMRFAVGLRAVPVDGWSERSFSELPDGL